VAAVVEVLALAIKEAIKGEMVYIYAPRLQPV
jgi:hypothetical protein